MCSVTSFSPNMFGFFSFSVCFTVLDVLFTMLWLLSLINVTMVLYLQRMTLLKLLLRVSSSNQLEVSLFSLFKVQYASRKAFWPVRADAPCAFFFWNFLSEALSVTSGHYSHVHKFYLKHCTSNLCVCGGEP